MHCREAGYSSPDSQYAAAGPKANYRASNPSSEPSVTYEVANMGSEGRRGNRAGGPREQLPEYAVVDKTKKKKKVRFRNEGTLVNGSYTLIVTRSQKSCFITE